MTTSKHALAKAKLHTLAMRAAAQAGVSAQAQGLLSVLIAEAWPNGPHWSARLGVELLARRLGNVSRHTVRSWAKELERSQLVRRKVGTSGRVSTWTLPKRFEQGCAGAPQGVNGRNGAGAPAQHEGVRQRNADSDCRCDSGGGSASLAGGVLAAPTRTEPRASPDPRDAVPRISPPLLAVARKTDGLARRSVRKAASCGDSCALELLREIGEIVDVRA